MGKKMFSVLVLAVVTMCFFSQVVVQAMKRCPNCGHIEVPYPLSTSPGCGDPLYKVRCNAGTLWLDTLNGSSYPITSINPSAQLLTIRPPGLANDSCLSVDFHNHGIILDKNLPFNVTGSNTVVYMNCTDFTVNNVYIALDCTSSSICHEYIRDNAAAKAVCGGAELNCCWFRTGGSLNAYAIGIRSERCSAYQSFVNLDIGLPVSKWPEPGVELEWKSPQEPECKVQVDCHGLADSQCIPDPASPGMRRCFCHAGFQWDPMNVVCKGSTKCQRGKHCSLQKNRTPLIGGAGLAAGAIILGILIMVLVHKRNNNRRDKFAQLSKSKLRERILIANNSSGMIGKIFTSKEILKATNNFSKDNLLGSGGFGEVFKGIFYDGSITAIKRAKLGNIKGSDQILNEVQILCQVNHRSLVRLLGCCVEFEEPLLVYEYISNGTLFEHLHQSNPEKRARLTWNQRLIIAHQTAEGLAYLHSSATTPIYHRDIKSSNILLDDRLDSKISDFGLSRLAVSEVSHITTCAQGTLGYLDPEYYLNFQLTDKSDVYSFGVVLLELLTSKKAIDFDREEEDVNLVVYVRKILQEDRLFDVTDPVLKEGASKVELETMKAMASLAAACLDEKRHNRPSMREAANEIEYIKGLVIADEK